MSLVDSGLVHQKSVFLFKTQKWLVYISILDLFLLLNKGKLYIAPQATLPLNPLHLLGNTMLRFNHGGFEAETPSRGILCPWSPAGLHLQSCACVREAAQVFQYVVCSSWLSPSASLGTKGLKMPINPVASSFRKYNKKENSPLHWQPVNFSGLALIKCWLLIFVPFLITPRLWKWLEPQEGCGDTVLSQKVQCLVESHATSNACPAAPCLRKGDGSVQGSRGTTTSSMIWGQMSGRKKNKPGHDPGKFYDGASSFYEENYVKLLPAITQLCTEWPKGCLQPCASISYRNSQKPLWRVFHLSCIWVCLLLYFPRLMLSYFFSLTLFLLHTNTQSFQKEKYYLLVCPGKVFSNPRCLNW